MNSKTVDTAIRTVCALTILTLGLLGFRTIEFDASPKEENRQMTMYKYNMGRYFKEKEDSNENEIR